MTLEEFKQCLDQGGVYYRFEENQIYTISNKDERYEFSSFKEKFSLNLIYFDSFEECLMRLLLAMGQLNTSVNLTEEGTHHAQN